MIGAIGAIGAALSELQSLAASASAPTMQADTVVAPGSAAPGASFADTLRAAVGRLDGTVASASQSAQSFAAGDHDIPLSDVMVSMEQANLAMQMAANVRDKVVAAYSTVMNMPL
jgi:flagellar hook-basal body complex protein FliE